MPARNDQLDVLIAEAGISHAGLARRVNLLGTEQGLDLDYDYTAVYRWVAKGQQPRGGVPELIAQALAAKLGRRVTPADFGMSADAALAQRSLAYPTDPLTTVETIVELGRADMRRRDVVKAPFVLAALAAPSRDWLLDTLEQVRGAHGPRRIGMPQVEGIRRMFAHFQEMDVMRGGGHARVALVSYLDDYVLPLVRRDHSEPVRRALYQAASEQTYLVGWMAYDSGQHGLAQRYLIQSLRLAQAGGDAALGGHVLAGMSDQANLLGHPRDALMLAKAGQQGVTSAESPACLTDLYVLEARAHGSLGEAKAAGAAVGRAEGFFTRVTREDEPEWARFIDPAYVFGEAAHCFRDLCRPRETERFAADSIAEAERQGRARRGSLSYAARSIAHLQRGEADYAAHEALTVLDLAGAVDSSRTREAVRDLHSRFSGHSQLPQVQTFNHRARAEFGVAA